jgi:CRISPR-associated protein Csd1
MRAIITGAPYPVSLFQGVIRRIRAEGDVNPLRAGILKATLNRQANREVVKMALDPNERDIPYVLGRLFALCEKAQRDALGEVNASIADKYFNTALASPQAVFPAVMKLNKAHIGKIEKDSTRFYLVNMITQVFGLLKLEGDGTDKRAFPETLDANGQGKFILGYYHQNQALYTKRDKGAEAAGASPDTQEEGGSDDGH